MLPSSTEIHLIGFANLKGAFKQILALGILLMVFGLVATTYAAVTTLVSVLIFGWLMIVGGGLQIAHAFSMRIWGGFFIDLLAGVLTAVGGLIIIANPLAAEEALTMLISMFLILGGMFRFLVGFTAPFQIRLWLVLHGLINLFLGFSIWQQWPYSGHWVIGLFVGIDMFFNGLSLVMLALAVKNGPDEPEKLSNASR
jgi:uncharacterized membrane protein HdeD (DUF308 family)